jgi:hypothetical protein
MDSGNIGGGATRCEKLRWKGMFTDSPPDPTIQPSNDRSYWCQQTLICIGPDSKAVDREECNPTRSCYEEL